MTTKYLPETWCTGPCECLQCGNKWVGVWPLGADDLECPKCFSADTVREEPPQPGKD